MITMREHSGAGIATFKKVLFSKSMVQKSAASMDCFFSSSSIGTRKAFSVGQKFLAGLRKTVVPGILFMALLLNVQKGWGQITVTYTQQTGNYYSNWKTGTADAFNQGANQVGMYANGGGTKQVVNWRKFRTDASGVSTSDRALQVGDRFVVTLSATRAFGRIGFALLASPGTGSWANRESNYAISFLMDLHMPERVYGATGMQGLTGVQHPPDLLMWPASKLPTKTSHSRLRLPLRTV
jgi:hypothetical protein